MGQTENPFPLRSSVLLCSETTRKRLLRRLWASLNSACASNTIWNIQEVLYIFIYLLVYKLSQEAWTSHKARSSMRPSFLLSICEFLNGSMKSSSFSARMQLCFAIVNCRNIALREASSFLVRWASERRKLPRNKPSNIPKIILKLV